jgi:alpha-tubulin suppressor-like RCC1 family protein
MKRAAWVVLPVVAIVACVGDSGPVGNDAGPDVTVNEAGSDVAQDVKPVTCNADAGQTACNNACVDTMTDSKNCGACNVACAGSFMCTGGKCGDAVTEIARGGGHVCLLLHDGSVWCRGESSFFQLGASNSGDPTCMYGNALGFSGTCTFQATFKKVPLSGAAAHVAAGGGSTCAVLATGGTVYCWGDNRVGQLGHAATTDSTCLAEGSKACQATPSQVLGIPDPVAQISMGTANVCVVTTKSDVYCWGSGQDGQLGDGNGVDSSTPAKPLGNATEVVVSYANKDYGGENYAHVCAITKANTVMCWGDNQWSQLGHAQNTMGDKSKCCTDYWNNAPLQATIGAITPKHLALSYGATCILDTNGAVTCFGYNAEGIVKMPPSNNSVAAPTAVSIPAQLVSLNAMSTHVCGGTSTGDTYCWGETTFGDVGGGLSRANPGAAVSSGTFNTWAIGPTKLTGVSVTDLRTGGGYIGFGYLYEGGGTIALTPDGGVLGWGQDSFSMFQEADGGGACDDAGNGHCVTTPQWLTGLP